MKTVRKIDKLDYGNRVSYLVGKPDNDEQKFVVGETMKFLSISTIECAAKIKRKGIQSVDGLCEVVEIIWGGVGGGDTMVYVKILPNSPMSEDQMHELYGDS